MIEDYLAVANRIRQELTDLERVARLVQLMPPAFHQVHTELLVFAEFLDRVGNET